MSASSRLLWAAGAALLIAAAYWAVPQFSAKSDIPLLDATSARSETQIAQEESISLCPWRDPNGDRKRFFPAATGSRDENYLLTRFRQESGQRLGRTPTGEENILRVHRLTQGAQSPGLIITQRLRGESGVIELVLAVANDGSVVGARLQRLREPDNVANALQSPAFLGAFRGKTSRSLWRLGTDIPDVPAAARPSAEAILDKARASLILLDVGSQHAQAAAHIHP